MHKIRLHTTIDRDYYREIEGIPRDKNKAKVFEENVGTAHIQYVYSPNGKVEVQISCSRNPYRIETESDESILFSFFGQIRDRMIFHLHDDRERMVKPLMDWTVVQCDLNRDVEVEDSMHLTFPSIQLKHVDRVFRIYIKSLGMKTVCRCEESMDSILPISEALKNIRNGCRE